MENTKIITLAYELARTKYKNKSFTFEQLWTDLVKKAKLDKDEQQTVGNVYTTMLQDHRFIFIGDRQWKIREFLKEEEQDALTHALYDFKAEQAEENKRLAELKRKEKESAETFKDEEELENEHKENKEKLMHDDSDEDESDKQGDFEESEIEEDEEDVE